jgi:SAM-dependent methyltransferase
VSYVHGYGAREVDRLRDQAAALEDLLHHDTAYPPGARVLEAGCGVGAQTVALARRSPEAAITSVDRSEASLAEARRRVAEEGHTNVRFAHADIFDLPYADGSFDHVFVCFVLEHLAEPERALVALGRVLRAGGTLTVIEGDHGSVLMHPESPAAHAAVDCLVTLQREAGGDAMVGRRLHALLAGAGFADLVVDPRMVWVDGGRPGLEEAFTRDTFTAMVEGTRASALEAGLIDAETFEAGIRALLATMRPGGSFGYTFFKGVGRR